MASALVSVVLAARDAERTIEEAVASVLGQTERDLELVVVDDGSVDATGELAHAVDDPRVRVVRNDAPLGLAGALNVGLDAASGTYVARMDADDVALPRWLETTLGRLRAGASAVVGSGMIDLDGDGRLGTVHRMPGGARAVRWTALFSSPFFHSTVVLDRAVLDEHGLRYDPSFGESEDYDLWARLLDVADGDNVREALVLYRKHETQASARRAALQRECQRRVALRQIAALVPDLDEAHAELAWLAGAGLALPDGTAAAAADAPGTARRGVRAPSWGRRGAPGRCLVPRSRACLERRPCRGSRRGHCGSIRRSPSHGLRRLQATKRRARRAGRRDVVAPGGQGRAGRRHVRPARARALPDGDARPCRGPARARADGDLRGEQRPTPGLGDGHATPGGRPRRVAVPGAYRVLRHDYPVSFDVFRALEDSAPEVVVVSGWSTFASQAAVAWCRRRHVPYVLLVESNERDARAGWRRAVKGAVVPTTVRHAAEVFVVGTLARESMLARGVEPDRLSIFADTIDPGWFGSEADRLRRSA